MASTKKRYKYKTLFARMVVDRSGSEDAGQNKTTIAKKRTGKKRGS